MAKKSKIQEKNVEQHIEDFNNFEISPTQNYS